MGLYYSGTAGYGFRVDYTDEVFTTLKEYFETTSGKSWSWSYDGAENDGKDYLGGYKLLPNVYVDSKSYDYSKDFLIVLDKPSKIDVEKEDLEPVMLATKASSPETQKTLEELAELFGAKLGPVLYATYS